MRHQEDGMFRRVLFATDGSPNALHAAEAIAGMAGHSQEMSVTVVAALGPARGATVRIPAPGESLQERAQRALHDTCTVFRLYGIPYTGAIVRGDCACTAIVDAARRDLCDLIAMGSTETPFVAESALGSPNLTDEVMQRALVPVLVIPPNHPLPAKRPAFIGQ